MEHVIGDYPTVSNQGRYRSEEAVAMFHEYYAVDIETLTAGQTVKVVYKSPDAGRVYVNLQDSMSQVVLHIDARYDWNGEVQILVLDTFQNNIWQSKITPPNFPFPCNGQQTTITLEIFVQQNDFLIIVNDVPLTTFAFRGSLTPDTVTEIAVVLDDETASTHAKLDEISISY